jgi:Tol biopolymer transport system component
MKPTRPVLLAALLCAALSAGLPAGQAGANPAEVALQAAIKAETVDGDLKGAIELYRKLAAGSDRAVAARALVRMGQCYEKLGDAQARQAYDRVVRDFADQKETVAAAKARLAALNRPGEAPPLAVHLVWAGPDVNTEGAPSWDGRFLSFTNQASGAVSLRDLAGGETRQLVKATADLSRPAGRSLISPDGKKVAYARSSGDGYWELRLINLDGSGERVFFQGDRLVALEPGAWSPDGARMVVASAMRDESEGIEVYRIVMISIGDGSARILKTLGPSRPGPRGISPDGRFIAYDNPSSEGSESRDIFLLAADGSREIPLVEHPADDRLLGWAPDGSGVLFASDRAGQWGAWFNRVTGGKPVGQPVSIYSELGPMEPLGFTRGGSFYFGVESGGTDAYVVELDPTASRITAAPALINERFAGRNQLPLYSPDGRSIAYFSNRSAADRWTLCIHSLGAAGDREFLVPHDLERLRIARWTPGGQGILVSGFDKQRHHMGFYEMDARNGDVRAILSSNPEADTLDGQWAPDGKSLFLTRAGFAFADAASRILQRDPATGREREVLRLSPGEEVTNLVLSPDGQELAFTARSRKGSGSLDRLGIVPARGGDAREILRLSGREAIRRDGLVWTPDGRYLLFAKTVEAAPRSFRLELWRAAARVQEVDPVGVLVSDMAYGDGSTGLRIHPEGKSIAFQAGRRKPEVWVLENVLPATKAGPAPEFLDELTLEAWINFSSLGPVHQAIVVKGNYNYDGVSCALNLNPEGRLHWGIRHGHTSFGESGDWSIDAIVGDTVLQPNTWYHVAGTVYSSRSASLYLNGALMKTGPITQTILARPAEPLHIGLTMYYGVPSYRFNGTVDGAALYERVLSADEIRQRYQAGRPRKG